MKTWEVIKTLQDGVASLKAVNVSNTLAIKMVNNTIVDESGSRIDINRCLEDEWTIVNSQQQVDLLAACKAIVSKDRDVLVYINGQLVHYYSKQNPEYFNSINIPVEVNYILNGIWYIAG